MMANLILKTFLPPLRRRHVIVQQCNYVIFSEVKFFACCRVILIRWEDVESDGRLTWKYLGWKSLESD